MYALSYSVHLHECTDECAGRDLLECFDMRTHHFNARDDDEARAKARGYCRRQHVDSDLVLGLVEEFEDDDDETRKIRFP